MQEVSSRLLTLTRHRWNIPVVAELGREGLDFSRLVQLLRVSRDSLSRTLRALAEPRWLKKHATEPHYRLTAGGRAIAPRCDVILETAIDQELTKLVLKRWTLPVAAALRGWTLHFGELRHLLPGITPRALTLALKEMQSAELVHREVTGGFPPATAYRLTDKGEVYLPVLEQL